MPISTFLHFASLSVVASFYTQPGIPPQCFDEYQCVFHRYPSETGLQDEYVWDLRSLCQGAGQEYTATSQSSTNIIKFNICGVVGKPIAPANDLAQGPQEAPIPHSHGVAIQLVDYDPANPNPSPPPGPNGDGTCADLDTCDYLTNPGFVATGVCTVGSLNYVAPDPAVRAPSTREQRCDPAIGGNPNYCSPYLYWCCSVQVTPCTLNAEVLSVYDGTVPSFNLWNEGDVNGGIYLSYGPALNYAADPFQCGGTDPSTGFSYTRSLYIRLDCDATVTSGLANVVFAEDPVQRCQYSIRASTAAACPTLVNPTPSITPTPSKSPSSSYIPSMTSTSTSSLTPSATPTQTPPAPAAAAAAATAPSVAGPAVGSFFGGAITSALVAFAMVYLGFTSSCPRAKGVGGGVGGGVGEASPLMAPSSSGQAFMRVSAPPSIPAGY